MFSFPRCISRRCNANAVQRILTFFARRNVGTRRCPRSRRAREKTISLSLSLFYRFLSPFSFPLIRRTLAFPFDLALAIDDDDGEDDTANCPLRSLPIGSVKQRRVSLTFVPSQSGNNSSFSAHDVHQVFHVSYTMDNFLVSNDTTTSRHSYEHAECLRHATGRSCRARRLYPSHSLSLSLSHSSFSFSRSRSISSRPPLLPFHPYSPQRT